MPTSIAQQSEQPITAEAKVAAVLESTSRRHKLDIKGAGRDSSSAEFLAFVETRASSQLVALLRPPTAGCVRVVCVRHGMGHHNDGFETASFMNRDAELNRIGVAQATQAGELLRAARLFERPERVLVVVSPMRRTLQTALLLLGADEWACPTVVQPLAAETNVTSRFRAPGLVKHLVSTIQQGQQVRGRLSAGVPPGASRGSGRRPCRPKSAAARSRWPGDALPTLGVLPGRETTARRPPSCARCSRPSATRSLEALRASIATARRRASGGLRAAPRRASGRVARAQSSPVPLEKRGGWPLLLRLPASPWPREPCA